MPTPEELAEDLEFEVTPSGRRRKKLLSKRRIELEDVIYGESAIYWIIEETGSVDLLNTMDASRDSRRHYLRSVGKMLEKGYIKVVKDDS